MRKAADWQRPKDALVIPGGESTVQMRLLQRLGLAGCVADDIRRGLPVFGTCAGLILLSRSHLATMDIDVQRNAYGRQLGSFTTVGSVEGVGPDVAMTFIRAPYITRVGPAAQALATVGGRIVAARQGRQLVTAFHPELTDDLRVHQYFLETFSA